MSLTTHYIDNQWKRVQLVLNVKPMHGSHTGQYIASTFLNLLQEWKIENGRVFLVLRDSGANVIKGMALVEVQTLSCFAHTVQLVVQDGLKAQRAVSDVLAKVRSIANHFNHSVLAKQRLHDIQMTLNLALHTILQAVPTHWNSSLTLLGRALEQKRALVLYSTEHGALQSYMPSSHE